MMKRVLTCTAAAVLLGLAPALAADTQSVPPTQPGATPEAAKQATTPDTGSADTSAGAQEQSSAPPSSGAAGAKAAKLPSSGGTDQSAGAKAQSSAPPGSAAADPSKPNPSGNVEHD
jgi:hypothetical protein